MNSSINLFLSQSYTDNWTSYQYMLSRPSSVGWDYFVITASNEEQANAYRIQIDERLKSGYLPTNTKYVVIPDPDGKRVGSGGATLNVLKEIYCLEGFCKDNAEKTLDGISENKECCSGIDDELLNNNDSLNPFYKKRILILHSGGDSKRVPQYSALGKLFSKVPRTLPDGRYSTLFDEFVIAFSGIPMRMNDGIVVTSGDVLLLFNHLQLDLMRSGAVGISIKVPAEMGSHHGVYYADETNVVKSFLHKMSVDVLQKYGAVNDHGYVDVDTGMVWFDSTIAMNLLKLLLKDGQPDLQLIDKYINEKVRLSFYGDFLMPLTKEATLEHYLQEAPEGEMCEELLECRRILWDVLNQHRMYVQRMHPAEFIHFGTSSELLELMGEVESRYSHLSWQHEVVSYNKVKGITTINSIIDKGSNIANGCYIEDSEIDSNVKIGNNCIISNATMNLKCEIADNTVLHILPVNYKGKSGYVARIYGINDNPKNGFDKGSFLNITLASFIQDNNIETNTLWSDSDNSLWNALLYPFCENEREAIEFALIIQKMAQGNATIQEIETWLKSDRLSLKSSFQYADTVKIYEHHKAIELKIRAKSFVEAMANNVWIQDAMPLLGSDEQRITKSAELVYEMLQDGELYFSDKIRLYRALAEVAKQYDFSIFGHSADRLEDISYEIIINAISNNELSIELQNTKISAERVVVQMPVRVNFGGGWSDTPPYCFANGGTVLNAAINLNGELPVKVTIEKLDDLVVTFESDDLGSYKTYNEFDDLLNYNDPTDPFALLKASLVACGIMPRTKGNHKLSEILSKLGGGIKIITEVDVPKGSGLGTSSILAGALAKAINQFFGLDYNDQKLFEQAFCMEQLMTTGGGWQDQVGGILPGIKLISSKSGIKQDINCQMVDISNDTLKELNDRLALVFTGQRRLAKPVLRGIMGGFMLNEPQKLEVLDNIQRLAVLMKYELEKGNVDKFADLLNQHWIESKRLSDGTSNTCIDFIIEVCKPYISGVMICGAGGGGFLQIILKDKESKEKLRQALYQAFQETSVVLYDCEIVSI